MGVKLPIMTEVEKKEEKNEGPLRVNMNRRWTTFLNDVIEQLKDEKKPSVTLRALGTAVNSLFTVANVFEREQLGSITGITTFDLKDEKSHNSKLGCEVVLSRGQDFTAQAERYVKAVEEAREQRKERGKKDKKEEGEEKKEEKKD